MQNRRKTFEICGLVILFCIIMAVVDGIVKADYFVKSLIKLVVFLGFPGIYFIFSKELEVKSLFIPEKRGLKLAFGLGAGVYAVILAGYILLKDVFDFSAITGALAENTGVHGENFVIVSLYISFINSLLEEFFFRGFAFLTLKKTGTRRFAYLFSAAVFSLYHVAMMIGWFSLEVFVIVLVGLFAGGIIFNYLNEKSGTVYPSWLVHIFANFAINTIGFMLFGIIPAV